MKEFRAISHTIQDGNKVTVDFANYWGLSFFDVKNKKAFVNFVGIILKKNEVLISFPKHFDYDDLSTNEKGKAIKSILTLIANGVSSNYNEENDKNFPIDSYLTVQDYYKRYGIHSITVRERRNGYGGRIDWQRTINHSSKVVQDDGIVFLPFVTIQVKNIGEFLAECMEFVLSFTYHNFSEYLDFLTPYKKQLKNPIFTNFNHCLKQLKSIRHQFFKDTEKLLIDSLIKFFKWIADQSGKLIIATTHFEYYWETMIELYLNNRFVQFKNDSSIEWGDGGDILFQKPSKEFIEDEGIRDSKNNTSWKIEFDHFYIDHTKRLIYLLDSKYIYKDGFTNFNYKQAFYYYYLKQYYKNYKIYNGLLAPTSKDYYFKLHVNRTGAVSRANRSNKFDRYKDGLLIYEHYINMIDVIEFIISRHLLEFKKNIKNK